MNENAHSHLYSTPLIEVSKGFDIHKSKIADKSMSPLLSSAHQINGGTLGHQLSSGLTSADQKYVENDTRMSYTAINQYNMQLGSWNRRFGMFDKLRPSVSGSVLWYIIRRFFLCSIFTILVIGFLFRKFAFILTLFCLKCFFFFVQRRSSSSLSTVNFRFFLLCDFIICYLQSTQTNWITTLCSPLVHAYSGDTLHTVVVSMMSDNQTSLFDQILSKLRNFGRQCIIAMMLYVALYGILATPLGMSGKILTQTIVDSIFMLWAFNLSEMISITCVKLCPMKLNLHADDICVELLLNSYIGEYLALSTLSERCCRFPSNSAHCEDVQLYSSQLWDRLPDSLVFVPFDVLNASRIQLFTLLLTRSYKADAYGVVQLQLGTFLERLLDMRDELDHLDLPPPSTTIPDRLSSGCLDRRVQYLNKIDKADLRYELTMCIRAIALRFGKSALQACAISKRHLSQIQQITLNVHH